MAQYTFKCKKDDSRQLIIASIFDEAIVICEECGEPMIRDYKNSSPIVRFIGDGFSSTTPDAKSYLQEFNKAKAETNEIIKRESIKKAKEELS